MSQSAQLFRLDDKRRHDVHHFSKRTYPHSFFHKALLHISHVHGLLHFDNPDAPNTRTSATCGNSPAVPAPVSAVLLSPSLFVPIRRKATALSRPEQWHMQGVSHERGTVHERTRIAVRYDISHFVIGKHGRKCHIASGKSLTYTHNVGLHAGMFPCKKFPGPSEAGCYFIKYQQQMIFLTQFLCLPQVFG